MKSISSSYEVELSDVYSESTVGSVNFNSYSSERQSTDQNQNQIQPKRGLRSWTGAFRSDLKNAISDDSSESGSYDASVETTSTDGRDDISVFDNSRILDNNTSRIDSDNRAVYKPQRTRSDLSVCTSASIHSSVSHFLTAVDNTVDKVVDTLIPLEDEDNGTQNKPALISQTRKGLNSPKSKQGISFKKVLSFTKRRPGNDNAPETNNNILKNTVSNMKRTISMTRKKSTIKAKNIGEDQGAENGNVKVPSILRRNKSQPKANVDKSTNEDDVCPDSQSRRTCGFGIQKEREKSERRLDIIQSSEDSTVDNDNLFSYFFKVVDDPLSEDVCVSSEEEKEEGKKKKKGIFKFRKKGKSESRMKLLKNKKKKSSGYGIMNE